MLRIRSRAREVKTNIPATAAEERIRVSRAKPPQPKRIPERKSAETLHRVRR